MNLDKIPEDRIFQNNTREEIKRWGNRLQYFHYMRSRGGHNYEGDSFCAYFKYADRKDLEVKLAELGVTLNKIEEGCIPFDPTVSYSFDDLDKLRITINHFPDLEQPQHVSILDNKVHVWVLPNSFELSVSGTKAGLAYKVSEDDFQVCMALEEIFESLNWSRFIDDDISHQVHCISKQLYPELFE